ncbi:MAG: DUF2239 family protein [Alphaproteobacteria bacterium]|nr:DUF2239 family protein [Alphaproteobacteria bacterium]
MNDFAQTLCTAFEGPRVLARGPLRDIALTLNGRDSTSASNQVLIFDDSSGQPIDIDTRGTAADILQRLNQHPLAESGTIVRRAPGRPKLGVVAREVTLLPRHWEWLSAQSGGASVALRKLVDEARRTNQTKDHVRSAHEATYRFMSSIAGNLPDYEEALRALFANDLDRFSELVSTWPHDIRDYALKLAPQR